MYQSRYIKDKLPTGDVLTLAELLGIKSLDTESFENEPRWRRLEILSELKNLKSELSEHWES